MHHVEQLRALLALINPHHLNRDDYVALLALARAIPHPTTSGGGGFPGNRPRSFGESVA